MASKPTSFRVYWPLTNILGLQLLAKAEHHCGECRLPQHVPRIPIYGTYNVQGKIVPGEEYIWCSCGYSKEQPWCDKTCEQDTPELVDENGAQKYCGVKFKATASQTIFSICGCKYTRTPPICDGTHGPMPANPTVAPCRCDLPEDEKLSW